MLSAATYLAAVTAAYCEREATCCTGGASGGFDTSGCETELAEGETLPFTALPPFYQGMTSPNVTLDLVLAQACISSMGSLSCGANSATSLQTLSSLCSSALVPLLQLGDTGCHSAFDCPSGSYCGPLDPMLDGNFVAVVAGGSGTCLAILNQGDACIDDGYSTDCASQAASGQGSYCGPTAADAGTLECLTPVANGQSCADTAQDQECTSGECVFSSTTYTCSSSSPFTFYLDTNVCTQFAE